MKMGGRSGRSPHPFGYARKPRYVVEGKPTERGPSAHRTILVLFLAEGRVSGYLSHRDTLVKFRWPILNARQMTNLADLTQAAGYGDRHQFDASLIEHPPVDLLVPHVQ